LLAAYGVPLAMIHGIMSLYTDTTAIVLTSDGHTDPFHVSKGILQGDTLTPFLFVLAVDWMMRRALTLELIAECGICVTPRRSSHDPAYYLSDLDFADDIELLSRNMSTAQKILTAVEKSANLVGLTINKSKTEYMLCCEVTADVGVQEPVTLSVDAGPIMKVDDFRYLSGCYRCEDQPVKHLVLWRVELEGCSRGQTNRMMYVKQLLRDSCCEMVDELQQMMKNRVEWVRVSHTTSSSE